MIYNDSCLQNYFSSILVLPYAFEKLKTPFVQNILKIYLIKNKIRLSGT